MNQAPQPPPEFQHTGEHLLLALYDCGRLWFRSPFDDANALGDAAEEFVQGPGGTHPEAELHLTINHQTITLARGPEIRWESLIEALQLPTRTMPGRDPEEIWISPAEYDRVQTCLSQAQLQPPVYPK